MSATHKAWYWLAAGVLALGLNGYYQDGGFQGLHGLAACTTSAVAEARAQFREVATLAEVALAERAQSRSAQELPAAAAVNQQDLPVQAQVRVAELQTRLSAAQAARLQARMARWERAMEKRQMRQAQVEIENGRLAVFTDSARVNLAMPPMPQVEVSVPGSAEVRVSGQPN
jgi:hypothetical protein